MSNINVDQMSQATVGLTDSGDNQTLEQLKTSEMKGDGASPGLSKSNPDISAVDLDNATPSDRND